MPKQTRVQKSDEAEIRTAYTEGVSKVYLRLHYHISEPRLRGILGDLYRRGQRAANVMKRADTRPTVMHHREIPHSYLGKVQELEKRGFTPSPEDITSEDAQPAPAQSYTPQEYFQAISDGLRSRDTEHDTLRQRVLQLEADKQKLLGDLSQCKLQMANWTGPVALPGRSLGNGG